MLAYPVGGGGWGMTLLYEKNMGGKMIWFLLRVFSLKMSTLGAFMTQKTDILKTETPKTEIPKTQTLKAHTLKTQTSKQYHGEKDVWFST